jgi:hypothetical protein
MFPSPEFSESAIFPEVSAVLKQEIDPRSCGHWAIVSPTSRRLANSSKIMKVKPSLGSLLHVYMTHQQFAASIHGHGHGGNRFGRRKGRPPVAARAHAGTAKILFLVPPPRLPFVAKPTGQRTRGRRYAIRFLASSIKNK